MAVTFFLVALLFCHLSAILSSPICPAFFNCQNLTDLNFPFYNSTDLGCGLMKLDCSQSVPLLQLSKGQSYNVIKSLPEHNTLVLHDELLEDAINEGDCGYLESFSLPNSQSIHFIIPNNITLIKCPKTPYFQQDDKLFSGYQNCSGLRYILYYKHPTDQLPVPYDKPPKDCSVIQLPLNSSYSGAQKNDLFSLLTPEFDLQFNVSQNCYNCNYTRKDQCWNKEDEFQCVNTKGITYSTISYEFTSHASINDKDCFDIIE